MNPRLPSVFFVLTLCGHAGVALGAEPGAAAGHANLFPRQTWQAPPRPAPVAAPVPPPQPTPPPVPFRYAGHLQEGEHMIAFLVQDKKQIIVRPGDVIDGVYKIENISAQSIDFIYLPLQQRQQIMTGARP